MRRHGLGQLAIGRIVPLARRKNGGSLAAAGTVLRDAQRNRAGDRREPERQDKRLDPIRHHGVHRSSIAAGERPGRAWRCTTTRKGSPIPSYGIDCGTPTVPSRSAPSINARTAVATALGS